MAFVNFVLKCTYFIYLFFLWSSIVGLCDGGYGCGLYSSDVVNGRVVLSIIEWLISFEK